MHFPGTAAQNPPNCIIMKTIFSPLVLSLCLLAVQPAFSADPALADRHGSRGLACTVCHADMPPKAGVQSDKCEACHGGMAKVAAKTDKNDINPHDSHVEGAKCLECHKGHKKPQLLCDQCHEFTKIRVP